MSIEWFYKLTQLLLIAYQRFCIILEKSSDDVINGESNFTMKTSIGNVFQDVYIYLSTSSSFHSFSWFPSSLLFPPTLFVSCLIKNVNNKGSLQCKPFSVFAWCGLEIITRQIFVNVWSRTQTCLKIMLNKRILWNSCGIYLNILH